MHVPLTNHTYTYLHSHKEISLNNLMNQKHSIRKEEKLKIAATHVNVIPCSSAYYESQEEAAVAWRQAQ